MSRIAATGGAANNSRRFVFLAVALGLLGAILVYAAFSRGSSDGGSAGDTPVVVARTEIPARTKVTQSMVEVKLVNSDSRSELAYAEVSEVVGQVTRFPIAANEQVLSSKVIAQALSSDSAGSLSYVIPPGKRAMAINISEVQNAGGLVLPGDYVDVLLVSDVEFGTSQDRQTQEAFLVQTLLQNIEVLAVSQTVVDIVPETAASASGQRPRNSEADPDIEAETVTLALTPEQAQRVYLAEGNGEIRLSVRPYGDGQELPINYLTELDLFPRDLQNPVTR